MGLKFAAKLNFNPFLLKILWKISDECILLSESQIFKNSHKYFIVTERGCPAAALRVWPWKTTGKTPIELCGDTLDTYKQILSESNVLQLSFYLADKAVGAKGFKATWTEIKVRRQFVKTLDIIPNFIIQGVPKNGGKILRGILLPFMHIM